MSVGLSLILNGWQSFLANGNINAGGFVYTYLAGSSTPATTYTTNAGNIANANPIQLNSGGFPASSGNIVEIWLTIGQSYKFVVYDSLMNLIVTYDNISGDGTSALNLFSGLYTSTFASLAAITSIVGQIITIKSHTSGNIGGGNFIGVSGSVTNDGGTQINSATGGIYWQRIYDGFVVDITWFGVIPVNTGIPAETTTIQQAVWDNTNFRGIHYPNGRYAATKLTQTNPNLGLIYGDGAIIIGTAIAVTNCLFELKQGNGLKVYGLILSGHTSTGQNQNYVCGMHWYTNNTSFYPGKADINIEISEFKLGLNIGMLVSQTTYYNTNQADGIAIDAPLSESSLILRTKDCPCGLRICQANGKITLSQSLITAENISWTTVPFPDTSCIAIELERFGEITMQGGSLECVQSSTGTLIKMNACNLMLDGVIIESASKNRIKGTAALRMSKLANYGFNSTSMPMFVIDSAAVGSIDVDNSWLAFPSENLANSNATLAKGVSDITTEAYAEAPNFLITLTDVELRDCAETSGAAWRMASSGVKTKYSNVRLTSIRNVSLEVSTRLKDAKLTNSSINLLASLIDNSNATITAYSVIVPSTTGGWTFTSGGGVYSYGKQAPSATLNIESLNNTAQTPTWCLRMQANALVSLTATSPSFNLEPFSYIYVTGWIYIGGGGSANIGIKMESRDFSDTLISTANLTLGAGNLLQSGWQPFTCWGQQVATGSKARIALYVENGIDAQWFGISAFSDK